MIEIISPSLKLHLNVKKRFVFLSILGEYLSGRSWTGLEQALGETPVEKAKQGQMGIAMGYQDEPPT